MNSETYGGFWRRAVAAVIDQIILKILYFLLFLLGMAAGLTGFGLHAYALQPDILMKTAGGLMLLYYSFCVLVNMAYFTYFHGYTGRTPGKMVMGLRVIQASGEAMTPGLAFLRWVGYLVSFLCFGMGYLWVTFDLRKQGWHDKIAGTVVVLKKEKYLDKASYID